MSFNLTLKELINELCIAHLYNTHYTNLPDELLKINSKSKNKLNAETISSLLRIVSFIQEGLLDLYTIFPIKIKRIDIEEYEAITTYIFSKEKAESYQENNNDDISHYAYIKDSKRDPFQDDIIKILSVYDDSSYRLHLNDIGSPHAVFTYTPNSIYVPMPITGKLLTIEYQANHYDLVKNEFLQYSSLTSEQIDKFLSQRLEIPKYFLTPLKFYVSGKIYANINGQEGLNRSQEYDQQYQSFLQQNLVLDLGNINTSTTTNNKVYQKGLY